MAPMPHGLKSSEGQNWMPTLRFTEQFIQGASAIKPPRKREEVRRAVELLAEFPHMGPVNSSRYIRETYGTDVRKLSVRPFYVIYQYDSSSNVVALLGLVHQRTTW